MDSFTVRSKVTRTDIPVLCADLADRLRGRPGGVVTCDLSGVADPDVVTVEALARLRLTARRHGWALRVRGADPGLLRLIGFLGLTDALADALGDALTDARGDALAEPRREPSGEPLREAEQREQVRRVEEVVDARDPPV